MSRTRSTVWRWAGAAAGALAIGAGVEVARRRRGIAARRGAGDATPLGSLRSAPHTVVTPDGVPLHCEVDEPSEPDAETTVTVVFVHGYALTLDCWHFQRAGYRGLVRTVFYDQRSHGRSGRSDHHRATIDQLGLDLEQVIEELAPDTPVVVVGHSMGGMSIVALAEQRPELFGDRIVGVGLVSTTAGGLDVGRILLPIGPARLGGVMTTRAIRGLRRGHRGVDVLRRLGATVAEVFTDVFAFGDEVPASYVRFVDSMLSRTPFEVLAEFFPSLHGLDKFHAVEALGRVPTTIVCGTADRLTSIGHSRKLHSRIEGSVLVEAEGAGHMVIMERHEQVNAALDQLLAASTERVGRR
ncbi:MAG: alpha/beta hydrolase [Actinomycetota bacterium]|nr:alpha/beta hydrolase [Actinomycetota bacterium]MEE3128625.1 alpha/beta hydrolase [Actinomycetota bacterium]